ncbi:MAG TPA: hypothetical protein VII06_34890 [Chloroflexota bacterium]|jgi:hypothetical protein
MEPTAADFERQLQDAHDRLIDEFGACVQAPVIEQATRAALATFENARVKTYLPVLAYRRARENLRALTRTAR